MVRKHQIVNQSHAATCQTSKSILYDISFTILVAFQNKGFFTIVFFSYFRWPVRSTWHYFHEIIRTWCSWRQWFRRQRTNSTFVRIFHFTQRSCGWSQTQFDVWHKTVLPAFIRSPSMYCLCGYWHYDLSKTTRKFKKKILLEIINNLLPAHWMFSRKTRNRIPNFSRIILTD